MLFTAVSFLNEQTQANKTKQHFFPLVKDLFFRNSILEKKYLVPIYSLV